MAAHHTATLRFFPTGDPVARITSPATVDPVEWAKAQGRDGELRRYDAHVEILGWVVDGEWESFVSAMDALTRERAEAEASDPTRVDIVDVDVPGLDPDEWREAEATLF